MGLANLPRLRWEDYLGNDAVAAAYRDLQDRTERVVTLHPLASQTPFWVAWRGGILVFADRQSPTVHHGIVHELIHAILMEEGYFRLTWGEDTQTRGALSNELQHPEVFRRMEGYGLDMGPYWREWEAKLRKGLARIMSHSRDQLHFHFLQVFTWLFFPSGSEWCLAEYRRFNPFLYYAALAGHEDAVQIGCSTPETHKQFLAVFKRYWQCYCVAHLQRNELGMHVLRLLQQSEMECVGDKVNARSEQFISDYLHRSGLV
jgi:hypothetical protein